MVRKPIRVSSILCPNTFSKQAALSLIQVDIPELRYQLAYEILQQELM